jgi:hypothetical protein
VLLSGACAATNHSHALLCGLPSPAAALVAALYLYQKHSATWERALKTPSGLKQLPTANRTASKKKRVESYRLRDVQDDPMADL